MVDCTRWAIGHNITEKCGWDGLIYFMHIFMKIHRLITKAIVEIAERRKSFQEKSCMTKHFVKIVNSLAIPAAGPSLWELLIEQVCRGM